MRQEVNVEWCVIKDLEGSVDVLFVDYPRIRIGSTVFF
jgi:hypothetical protein